MRDFVVVGGGIAGLAVAEILQRSGRSVLLLEANDRLCAQASAQQQGWFHTGALYAALPSSRYFKQLVGNLDDLFNYYGCFPNMNLVSGRYLLTRQVDGWFRNSTCYYFFASARDKHIPAWQRPLWYLAVLRAQSRLSWFETVDFTRELSPQVNAFNISLNLSRCLARRRFGFDLGPVSKVTKSRDRTLDTALLMRDLLDAYLGAGGEVLTRAQVVHIERGQVSTASNTYRCRHVIVAAGKNAPQLASLDAKVVKSPLLVVKPALCDVNFIKMSPNLAETFNHLYHPTPTGEYSLIGNALYFPQAAPVDEPALQARMRSQASKVFGRAIGPSDASLYFGYKTEVVGLGQLRNYQYQIIDTDTAIVVLPGKLTFAFSLAVNVAKHLGIDPVSSLGPMGSVGSDVDIGWPEHYQRYLALP